MQKVGGAVAVRAAETVEGLLEDRLTGQAVCQATLIQMVCGRPPPGPDRHHRRPQTQVIDMPVAAPGFFEVMFQAGGQSTGPMGAPHIEVQTIAKIEGAEAANRQAYRPIHLQKQHITTLVVGQTWANHIGWGRDHYDRPGFAAPRRIGRRMRLCN